MKLKTANQSKRLKEVLRLKLKESHATEMLGFALDSVDSGRRAAVGRATAAQATARRRPWRHSRGYGRYGSGDCLLYDAAERDGAGHGGIEHQLPGGSAARPSEGRRARLARGAKLRCGGMRDSNRGRLARCKSAAHLRSSRRAYPPKVTSFTLRRPSRTLRHPCKRT